ncbi:MAG: hypothetical protein IJM43_08215 [Bacteroidaceae bacterium]|nr:hypothetical protein [Bacteroidaceae bacterium]
MDEHNHCDNRPSLPPRIPRGNDFSMIVNVAGRYKDKEGKLIENFDLRKAENIKVFARRDRLQSVNPSKVEVLDNTKLQVFWNAGVLGNGQYTLEVSGIWNNASWRAYNITKNIFIIVESNEQAYIPADNFVNDVFYFDTEFSIMYGTQADWNESDPSDPSFIKNKPSTKDFLTKREAKQDYVEKEPNKGLSEENFTKKEKDKLSSLKNYNDTEIKQSLSQKQDKLISGENIKTINGQTLLGEGDIDIEGSGGEENVIETVKVNGSALTPDQEKAVNIPVPTEDTVTLWGFIKKTIDDLTNYYTKLQTYTRDEVQQLINAVKQFTYELVSVLPTASSSTMNKIYLVPSSDPQIQNVKDEYITIQNGSTYSWEQIGSTAIDLSGYVTTTALNNALADYTTTANLNALLAGYQIKIDATHKLDYSLIGNTPTIPDVSGKADKVLIVNHGTSDTTFAVTPNALHVWGEVAALTLTLAAPADSTIENEYKIQFTSGATATQFAIQDTITWGDSCGAISLAANKIYQISIINGLATWESWAVS